MGTIFGLTICSLVMFVGMGLFLAGLFWRRLDAKYHLEAKLNRHIARANRLTLLQAKWDREGKYLEGRE